MKVYVAGYWNTNLGDDLFLMLLSKRYPQHDFYIIAGHHDFAVFSGQKNLHLVKLPFWVKVANHFGKDKWLFSQQIKTVKKMDAYCELGGSLFILPKTGMGKQFAVRKQILATGIPYFIIGSNFGPYNSKRQVTSYHTFFTKVRHVTFRDQFSYNLFADLPNVSCAPDVAFNLDPDQFTLAQDYILFSVIDPHGRVKSGEEERYYAVINELVNRFLNQGERVVLMPFCAAEGDLRAAQKIAAKFANSHLGIYVHKDLKQSLIKLARAKAVVASRYHAMILSWLFQKPTFVLSYSEKINHVIADLCPEQPYLDIRYLKAGQSVKPQFVVNQRVSQVRKQAVGQFIALDHFLNKSEEGQ